MCQASLLDYNSICDFSLEGLYFYRLVKEDSKRLKLKRQMAHGGSEPMTLLVHKKFIFSNTTLLLLWRSQFGG